MFVAAAGDPEVRHVLEGREEWMATEEHRSASQFKLALGGTEASVVFKQGSGLEQKAPGGPSKAGNIMLKRGVDENLTLWKWLGLATEEGPEQARVDGTIEVVDHKGAVMSTFSFKQGWPIKYGVALSPRGDEVELEMIEIAHEGLQRA
jgi:phage tail-like protein